MERVAPSFWWTLTLSSANCFPLHHPTEIHRWERPNWRAISRPRTSPRFCFRIRFSTQIPIRTSSSSAFILSTKDRRRSAMDFIKSDTYSTSPHGLRRLFSLVITSDPNQNFFFVGFHTFDERPATISNGFHKERYVFNFSSWVTPFIFFGDNFRSQSELLLRRLSYFRRKTGDDQQWIS